MDSDHGQNALRRPPTLVDIVDRVLHKGIVIEAHLSVAVAGLALATVEAHVVVASIDTYLGYKRRLDASRRHVDVGVDLVHGEGHSGASSTAGTARTARESGTDGYGGPRNRITGYLVDDPGSGDVEGQ